MIATMCTNADICLATLQTTASLTLSHCQTASHGSTHADQPTGFGMLRDCSTVAVQVHHRAEASRAFADVSILRQIWMVSVFKVNRVIRVLEREI